MLKKFLKVGLTALFFLSFLSLSCYGKDKEVTILFLDKLTSQPIINHPVEFQQVIYCKPGADCHLPILFTGTTDRYGKIYVPVWLFDYYFNVVLDGYPLNGPFKRQKDSNVCVRHCPNGRIESFNYKTGAIVIGIISEREGVSDGEAYKKRIIDNF